MPTLCQWLSNSSGHKYIWHSFFFSLSKGTGIMIPHNWVIEVNAPLWLFFISFFNLETHLFKIWAKCLRSLNEVFLHLPSASKHNVSQTFHGDCRGKKTRKFVGKKTALKSKVEEKDQQKRQWRRQSIKKKKRKEI